jgi:hypothetical protein
MEAADSFDINLPNKPDDHNVYNKPDDHNVYNKF